MMSQPQKIELVFKRNMHTQAGRQIKSRKKYLTATSLADLNFLPNVIFLTTV